MNKKEEINVFLAAISFAAPLSAVWTASKAYYIDEPLQKGGIYENTQATINIQQISGNLTSGIQNENYYEEDLGQ
jgi:hypothetical protein